MRGVTRRPNRRCGAAALGSLILLSATLGGCSSLNAVGDSVSGIFGSSAPAVGTPGYVRGFLGAVVADEPNAALVGREVLSAGGNAVDAAVATGFALAVSYPSRAGLGGGGACLALMPAEDSVNGGNPDAVVFVPPAPSRAGPGDRPAAVPMLARGLFALHARYGRRPFESLIVPAEQRARFGIPVSRAFARDLAVVAGPLAADPPAASVFLRQGRPLAEGDALVQPDLAATLTALRTAGVGDLYQGTLARRLVAAVPAAGAAFTLDDLRAALPRIVPPLSVPANGRTMAAFLPPPADGGLAAASAFQALRAGQPAAEAGARGLGTATLWRRQGGDPAAVLAAAPPAPALPLLPASTTFLTLDKDGNAVVCAVTMNNLFGTGRIAAGTGVLLAASPAAVPPPLLAAGIAWNGTLHAFRAAVGGSGQDGAPLAAALVLDDVLKQGLREAPAPLRTLPPDPGRANAITCNAFLPEETRGCGWAVDPRSAGLAVGSS